MFQWLPAACACVRANRLDSFTGLFPSRELLVEIHGYIVPDALHHSITAIAQPGKEPLVGQRVSYLVPP